MLPYTPENILVVKLGSTGTPDGTFGTNGIALPFSFTINSTSYTSIAIQPITNEILLGFEHDTNAVVGARLYNTNGAPDLPLVVPAPVKQS